MAIHTTERNMPVSLRFCSRDAILAYNPGMGKKWRVPLAMMPTKSGSASRGGSQFQSLLVAAW